MNELFSALDPSSFDLLAPFFFAGFVHKKIKKAVKKIGKVGQKIIDVHKNVAKKLEQTFRPVLKLGAVAIAGYYGGPQGAQLAYGAAFRDKSGAEVPQVQYSEPYSDNMPYGTMGGVYPITQYPSFGGGGGYAPSFGGGGDAPAPSAGVPPWMILAGIGGAVLLLIIILRR